MTSNVDPLDTLLTSSGDWRFRTDLGAKFGRSLAARYV